MKSLTDKHLDGIYPTESITGICFWIPHHENQSEFLYSIIAIMKSLLGREASNAISLCYAHSFCMLQGSRCCPRIVPGTVNI